MPEDTRVRSAKLPAHIDEKFQQFRDEHDLSNSDALRELARRSLQEWEEGESETEDQAQDGGKIRAMADGGFGFFSKFLHSLSAISFVFTLHYAIVGEGIFAVIGFLILTGFSLLLILSGQDRALDRYAARVRGVVQRKIAAKNEFQEEAREKFREKGYSGVYAMMKQQVVEDHPAPNPPQNIVERVAWWDLKALRLIPAAFIWSVLLAGAVHFFGAAAIVATVTPTGALVLVAVPIVLLYAWPVASILSALALLSIDESRADETATIPEVDV